MDTGDYTWIAVVGGITAVVMAFGIGANDVANAFGPSVGSKALKLWQAVIVAAIFEFTGSVLMGGAVVKTISKGIANPSLYNDQPAVLMLGMLCALSGAGLWILIATKLSLPVSTTHSIVGAIIGFSICAKGPDSIKWADIGGIVGSWFLSPVLAGLMAGSLFVLVRKFILRDPNSLERAFIFYPGLISITIAVNVFFVMYKGPFKNVQDTVPYWQGILIAIGGGLVTAIVLHFVAVPWLRNRVQKGGLVEEEDSRTSRVDVEKSLLDSTSVEGEYGAVKQPQKKKTPFAAFFTATMGKDIHNLKSEKALDIHANAESFDPKTEHLFSYLQVATACFASFAHGANDVANSVAPFAMIIFLYQNGTLPSDNYIPPLWILCLGGGGIVTGLALYGWKVMRTLATELIKMTSSRGFIIEMSAATIVITASILGWPISSTHCQVGATVSVGACEGIKSGFNTKLFAKTFASWIVTIFFSGLVSATLFSFAYFSPSSFTTMM